MSKKSKHRRACHFTPSTQQIQRAHELGLTRPDSWVPESLSALQLDSFFLQIEEECRRMASIYADIAKEERGIPSMENSYLSEMLKQAGFAEVLRFVRTRILSQPPIFEVTATPNGGQTTKLIGFVAPAAKLSNVRPAAKPLTLKLEGGKATIKPWLKTDLESQFNEINRRKKGGRS